MSLGEKLIQTGMLTRQQWEEAEQAVAAEGGFVGAILVQRGFVSADALGRFLEEAFGIPTLDSAPVTPDPTAYDLAPLAFWREISAVPLGSTGGVLTVALTRPLDVYVLDRLKREFGLAVRPVFAEPDALMQVLTPSDAVSAAAEMPESLESSPEVEGDEHESAPPSVVAAAGEAGDDGGCAVTPLEDEAATSEDAVAEPPDAQEPAVVVAAVPQAVQRDQPEEWDASEQLAGVFALMEEQPGWVAVVGEVGDRMACFQALRSALEERGRRVIYFSAAERPYGELELLDQASHPVLMIVDLDELEGHVPEQALLLQEVRKAHARGFGLVVGAGEPPARLRGLEPGLRVAVSLARVFALGRRAPAWFGAIVREAAELLTTAGARERAERLHECLRSGDPPAAVSSAIEACKALVGSE